MNLSANLTAKLLPTGLLLSGACALALLTPSTAMPAWTRAATSMSPPRPTASW